MLDVKAMRAAQASMRPATIKRFFKAADIAEIPGGFVLTLDGRHARTPKKRPLALPTRALAEALAAEWTGQGEAIIPAKMPLTRLANSAIDGVADTLAETRATIAEYAQSDLCCFRAHEPSELVSQQEQAYAPVLAFAREQLRADFKMGVGIMPLHQTPETLAKVSAAIGDIEHPLALAALHVVVSMASSALLGLALWRRAFDAETVWRLAHVDEDFQIAKWGEDDEALVRRANRLVEMRTAALVIDALAPPRATP